MVKNNGISASATRGAVSPSNAPRELGIGVGKEELFEKSEPLLQGKEMSGGALTMLSRTPFTLPHALITKGSLDARTATMSTPFSFSLGRF